MNGFFLALQFLTIIPIRPKQAIDEKKLPQGLVYFPLIGLVLGLILAASNRLLSLIPFTPLLSSAILVTLLIILTGGLHLDGLADTFDALFSGKTKLQMLKIMRDAQIGTMGVLSLICVILLNLALLYSLHWKVINLSLILMCLLSRYCLILVIFSFPYVRKEGKAQVFIEGMNLRIFLLATTITLICSGLLWGLRGLIVLLAAAAFALLAGRFIARKVGGMTGDTLGAINELAQTFVLLNILILK